MRLTLSMVLAALAVSAVAAPRAPRTVALVGSLEGTAQLAGPGPRAVHQKEWLRAGERVSLGPESRLVVIYRSGRRFEARTGARVKVGREVLEGGGVRELERLPAWPTLPSLRREDVAASLPAAERVRAATIAGLRPAEGDRTLAGDTRLSFELEPGATLYAVDVRDESGQAVFESRTREAQLVVPAGLLEPGRGYVWSVETIDHAGSPARGQAGFRTLPADLAEVRQAIQAQALQSGAVDALAYLGALDAELGLGQSRDRGARASAN